MKNQNDWRKKIGTYKAKQDAKIPPEFQLALHYDFTKSGSAVFIGSLLYLQIVVCVGSNVDSRIKKVVVDNSDHSMTLATTAEVLPITNPVPGIPKLIQSSTVLTSCHATYFAKNPVKQ